MKTPNKNNIPYDTLSLSALLCQQLLGFEFFCESQRDPVHSLILPYTFLSLGMIDLIKRIFHDHVVPSIANNLIVEDKFALVLPLSRHHSIYFNFSTCSSRRHEVICTTNRVFPKQRWSRWRIECRRGCNNFRLPHSCRYYACSSMLNMERGSEENTRSFV